MEGETTSEPENTGDAEKDTPAESLAADGDKVVDGLEEEKEGEQDEGVKTDEG